nr:uncharacterized protein LOC104650240 [Saimiri boliviensis boliviensis]
MPLSKSDAQAPPSARLCWQTVLGAAGGRGSSPREKGGAEVSAPGGSRYENQRGVPALPSLGFSAPSFHRYHSDHCCYRRDERKLEGLEEPEDLLKLMNPKKSHLLLCFNSIIK